MSPTQRFDSARGLVLRFVERTGLDPPAERPRRYLWTDAHAVGCLLELQRLSGGARYLRLAASLVEQVHQTLGRHRSDDPRRGWISGLPEAEGRDHPTCGGLRIGKPLPERATHEPFDERAEWERDGQYFHYLTRWMRALAQMARATNEERYLRQAVELAHAAHRRFTFTSSTTGRRCMHWKMSIDLRRPLVATMGAHDALDGLLTLSELRAAVGRGPALPDLPRLDDAIADMRAMQAGLDCTTDDALGIGGLLVGACVLARLIARGLSHDGDVLAAQLAGARAGLTLLARGPTLRVPLGRRLAFRELGLALGLQAVPHMLSLCGPEAPGALGRADVRRLLASLGRDAPLADRIVATWLAPAQQDLAVFRDHLDINAIGLAAALLPESVLAVGVPD